MDIRAVGELVAMTAPGSVLCAVNAVEEPGGRVEEWAAGRAAAAEALTRLGEEPAGGPLGVDADGLPRWPRGTVGSISHSGGVAAAVVGSAVGFRGVGVDVETRLELAADLHGGVASPWELVAMSDLHGCGVGEAAARLFAAKEAMYKAHFPVRRRRYDFRDVELVHDGVGWAGQGEVLGEDVITIDVRASAAAGVVVAVGWW